MRDPMSAFDADILLTFCGQFADARCEIGNGCTMQPFFPAKKVPRWNLYRPTALDAIAGAAGSPRLQSYTLVKYDG